MSPDTRLTPGTHPELLVVATGAGSLVLSHVNDSGFWLIKEFFNMNRPVGAAGDGRISAHQHGQH